MPLKKFMPLVFVLCAQLSAAQQIIYSANFENKKIGSAWQIVVGNWRIGDVQELRIAPAEGGYRHILLSGGHGYIGDQIIRLNIDLPHLVQFKRIKVSFYYYVLANAPGIRIEGEFYQKEMKDGIRGKPWVTHLHIAKGRWTKFRKTLKVPADANTLRIVFYGLDQQAKWIGSFASTM